MIYRIVNPSDPYTIEAQSFDVAAVACLSLGRGQYSFEPIDEDGETVPFFIFGGADEWCQKHFSETLEQLVDRVMEHKVEELAVCLDSVLIGKSRDRKTYADGLALIDDPAKKKEWRLRWHDERRSSLNDIGGRAYALAKRLRGEHVTVQPAPQQVFSV